MLPQSKTVPQILTFRRRNHSFTWLNSRREPVELPAYEYMQVKALSPQPELHLASLDRI